MKPEVMVSRSAPANSGSTRLLTRIARSILHRRLAQLPAGLVRIIDRESETIFGDVAQDGLPMATVNVHDDRFYSELAFGGSIGAGEAYMRGYWSSDDLTMLMRILVRNLDFLDQMEAGLARITAPLQKTIHWLRRNTRRGSRRNIAAHYDLGNDFFALFLDESMMYSSAVFEHTAQTLEEASVAKLDRICQKLQLGPDDKVLEIGTGWGGFAMHAARHYGCRVTTTTISREQYELARQRIHAAGLADRIDVLLMDYRALKGRYDKLVSIEMIEAVGHAYYDTFFSKCNDLLEPDGQMLLQAITIADQRFEQARHSVDFIQRYIFPGSCLPSVTAISTALTRATTLRTFHLEDIGPHYATTLRHWRERFMTRLPEVRALGYAESFVRMWEFYLCYCEAGFAERTIGDVQMVLTKPACRRMPIASSMRDDAKQAA